MTPWIWLYWIFFFQHYYLSLCSFPLKEIVTFSYCFPFIRDLLHVLCTLFISHLIITTTLQKWIFIFVYSGGLKLNGYTDLVQGHTVDRWQILTQVVCFSLPVLLSASKIPRTINLNLKKKYFWIDSQKIHVWNYRHWKVWKEKYSIPQTSSPQAKYAKSDHW